MQIVILHGWGHDKTMWEPMTKKLGGNAIALDLPGFGIESLPDANWGVPDYANWVNRKISKYKNVVLIGHSFGGRIAAQVASQNPQNLKGLILTGAPCLYRPGLKTRTKITVYKFFKIFVPKDIRRFFYTADLRKAGRLEAVFRNVVAYDQEQTLKKINVPTLLLWGQNDKDAPLNIAGQMHSIIPDSQLKIVENAGHNLFLEQPDLFYGHINKFVKRLK